MNEYSYIPVELYLQKRQWAGSGQGYILQTLIQMGEQGLNWWWHLGEQKGGYKCERHCGNRTHGT